MKSLNHDTISIFVNEKFVYSLDKKQDKVFSYVDNTFKDGRIEGSDATFKYSQGNLFLECPSAFINIRSPSDSPLEKFYINTKYYLEELLLGYVQLGLFRQNEQNYPISGYVLLAQKIGDPASKKYAKCSYPDNVYLLGRGSEILSPFNDQNISSTHCLLGFDQNKNMFYVFDYGRNGAGSINGTQVRIRSDKPYLIYKNVELRIIFPPRCDIRMHIKF